jgi:Mrp family chromosome partitioning ATPase
MLAALKRLEIEQPKSRRAVLPRDDDPIAVTQVVRVPFPAAPCAGGLSSHVFWQPLELETTAPPLDEPQAHATQPVAIDIAPGAAPLEPAEKDEPHDDSLRNSVLRKLAPALLRKLHGSLPAAILATSVDDAADASRFVADLSRIFCEEQSLRVLAIDAECGRSTQRASCGLREAIEDPGRLLDGVHTTAIDGLSILPGGVGIAARNRSSRWSVAPLLEACRREFDLVLIDGGLAASAATLPLATASDATVLLARLGETDARDARRLVKSLRKDGAKVLGCVLTGSPQGD